MEQLKQALDRVVIDQIGFVFAKAVQDDNLGVLNKDFNYTGILYINRRPGNSHAIDVWIDWYHAIKHKNYAPDGAKDIFGYMAKDIIASVGWSQHAVQLITLLWASHYGQIQYLENNRYAVTDVDRFIQAAMNADNLEDIL